MRLFPHKEFLVQTNHTKARIQDIINENIHVLARIHILRFMAKLFVYTDDSSFEIMFRGYIIKGRIDETDRKARIAVSIRMHYLAGFSLAFIGIMLPLIVIIIFQSAKVLLVTAIVYGVFSLIYIACAYIGIYFLDRRYKKMFSKMFVEEKID